MGCEQSTPVYAESEAKQPLKGVGQTERLVSRAERIKKKKKGGEDDAAPKLDTAGKLMPEEVARRTESSPTTSTLTLGTEENPIIMEYAYWTQRGHYPDTPHKDNQDSFNISLKFGGSETGAMLGIYDGHGSEGVGCSQFAHKKLPKLTEKYVRQLRAKKYKEYLKENSIEAIGFDPKKWPLLTEEEYEECCRKAFLDCNEEMHHDTKLEDKMSGTTAVTVHFHGDFVTVCNVGDSRAVLGHAVTPEDEEADEKKEEEKEEIEEEDGKPKGGVLAIPLSHDHTAYRKDERERVKKTGAVIMSIDQMEGFEDMHDNWGDLEPGEFIDIQGDPPRVWLEGKDYPGTAFTRSIGDYIAEGVGVTAEPEILTTRLDCNDRFLVIASDGIFEFLANQEVIDICARAGNPLKACQDVVKAAYDQWLIHENRTDDITVIVCFLSCDRAPTATTSKCLVSHAFETKLVRRLSRPHTSTASTGDTVGTDPESDSSGGGQPHSKSYAERISQLVKESTNSERLAM